MKILICIPGSTPQQWFEQNSLHYQNPEKISIKNRNKLLDGSYSRSNCQHIGMFPKEKHYLITIIIIIMVGSIQLQR